MTGSLKQIAAACFFSLFIPVGCKRETREPAVLPPYAQTISTVRLTTQRPGPTTRPSEEPPAEWVNDYEQNAFAMSEGKRLYHFYNCNGCHANGGGGMGVPLMDDTWIYGSRPEQIFSTIVQGRPNGMPSFMGLIPDYQVWQLVAYVRSMSGQVSKTAAPGRSDDMFILPEHSRPTEKPKDSGISKPAEMPI